MVAAQQTAWWSVRQYVLPLLQSVGAWPLLGSPEWCSLDPDDPRKKAAVYDGAQHWALRLETCQTTMADAGRAVSGALNWAEASRDIRQRQRAISDGAHIPRQGVS
ncbi:hypothetical protein A4G31_26775 [Mycobacterium persicum]|nr:hypothetical protein A4G31_26775 [Mycobacterium persicum]